MGLGRGGELHPVFLSAQPRQTLLLVGQHWRKELRWRLPLHLPAARTLLYLGIRIHLPSTEGEIMTGWDPYRESFRYHRLFRGWAGERASGPSGFTSFRWLGAPLELSICRTSSCRGDTLVGMCAGVVVWWSVVVWWYGNVWRCGGEMCE